jgi:hypothetical protein
MAKSPAWQTCISCNKEGDKSLFAKGGKGMCNRCYKINWEEKNPDKVRAQRLWGNAYKRAKSLGWPEPDFDTEWIYNKIIEGYCEATGIMFDLTSVTRLSNHAKNPWVPSIDRIDSSKPYLKNNVQIVVYMYNVCKAEFSHQDVITFCKAVKLKEDGKIQKSKLAA